MCLWAASYKKKIWKKYFFASLKFWRKESDPELDPDLDALVRGTDPDPHQNVRDPQHCFKLEQNHHTSKTYSIHIISLLIKKALGNLIEYCITNGKLAWSCRWSISPRRSTRCPCGRAPDQTPIGFKQKDKHKNILNISPLLKCVL